MKKAIAAASLGLCVILGFTAAYFSGYWIPNDPSPIRYPVRGIDVSSHQGEIDWTKVAKDGVDFAYLKATEGGSFKDPKFQIYLREAQRAGLACGAYHFFSLRTPGYLQARNFIQSVPENLPLPPAIDLEYWGNSSIRPAPAALQRELTVFVRELRQNYGREPVFYLDPDLRRDYLKGFPVGNVWFRAVFLTPEWSGAPHWLFWQFTEKARISGIKGFVDADLFSGTVDQFKSLEVR
ncbi:MAG TPA: GH25 family lysozyme [Candidatus Methylacidiphilales bacterium]|nr:GH25 family lysozyme [Candidatus Methylacidiphilales bacterium]